MRALLLASTTETTEDGGSGLIEVGPGPKNWTRICCAIAFFVLKKYAFGPIQKTIDERRDRIRQAVEEADNARNEARDLLEQNRAVLAQARNESADILAEARKVADAQMARAKEEAEAERLRRLEDTRKQIEAETARSIDQIRSEVADLTIEATSRVVGKVLDADDQRRLIEEAVEGLDFSALERGRS
jgi:F-type H+-transporting ATPase subunit b